MTDLPDGLRRSLDHALPALHRRLDGEAILADVAAIVTNDRWNSFDRFHHTTATLIDRYAAAGVPTELHRVPTGEGLGTGRWRIAEAADVLAARLVRLDPEPAELVTFADNPWLVAKWSACTPADGIRGRLAVIDEHEERDKLRPGELAGCVVLTRQALSGQGAKWLDKGAAVVISDAPVANLEDATPWASFGWGSVPLADGPARPVGLAVSQTIGADLRRRADQGQVDLLVEVDARRYPGSHDVLSGLVRGAGDPQSELWVIAHGAEPGACDNASGVAVALAAARAMEAAIAAGELRRPKRTIRFLTAYECYGFFAYLEQIKRFERPVAGLVIDCVGLRPELCGGRYEWHDSLAASPGFVNQLGLTVLTSALAIENAGYEAHPTPFVSTSDTLLGDPQYGFPCPWLCTWNTPAKRGYAAYHSSADTVDVLSGSGLVTAALASAGYLHYLADAGTPEVIELAAAEANRCTERLTAADAAQNEWLLDRFDDNLRGLRRLAWGATKVELDDALDSLRRRVVASCRTFTDWPDFGDARVPRRTAPLSPTLENMPGHLAVQIRESKLPAWALFWADGCRSIGEIARAVSLERQSTFSVEACTQFFEAHAALGYVELLTPDQMVTEAQLVEDLRALGLAAGMDCVVHSSLKAIGPVLGGAETVIRALVAALGTDGTLLMPSFNHAAAEVFNPLATRTTNGVIPDTFWRRSGVMRSDHPTHAVAAYGPRAADYLADHTLLGCWTANSPLGRLVARDGWILSLGVGHDSSTVYHVGEVSVPATCLDSFGSTEWIVRRDGAVAEAAGLAWRGAACPVSPRGLAALLESACRAGSVGHATALLTPARAVYEARRQQLAGACPSCSVRPYPRALRPGLSA